MANPGVIRIAKRLVAMARMLLAMRRDDIERRVRAKRHDLKDDELAGIVDCIDGMKNNKRQLAAVYWIGKKSMSLPDDLDKFEDAMTVVDKASLDYQKFDGPGEVLSGGSGSRSERLLVKPFNPDSEKAFFGKKSLGSGITVYRVDNSREGQLAVRRAIDANWGYDANPWCLAARKSNFGPDQLAELAAMTEEEKKLIGYDEKDDLSIAWTHWKGYDAYPKRIAFKGKELISFCAGHGTWPEWWDRNDKPTPWIPGYRNVQDDKAFLEKYFPGYKQVLSDEDIETLLDDIRTHKFGKFPDLEDNDHSYDYLRQYPFDRKVFMEIAKGDNIEAKRCIAQNKNITADALEYMALNDSVMEIREKALSNPVFPQDERDGMIERLLKVEAPRKGAGGQSGAFVEFESIFGDPDKDDKRKRSGLDFSNALHLIRTSNLSAGLQERLAGNEDCSIRAELARNGNIDDGVLRMLLEDTENEVVENAVGNERMKPGMWEIPIKAHKAVDFNRLLKAIARMPACPADALRMCFDLGNDMVKSFVVCYGKKFIAIVDGIPAEELVPFVDDMFDFKHMTNNTARRLLPMLDDNGKLKIAEQVTDKDMIRAFAGEDDPVVNSALARNRMADGNVLRRIYDDMQGRKERYDRIPGIRIDLCSNPNTPHDIAEDIVMDHTNRNGSDKMSQYFTVAAKAGNISGEFIDRYFNMLKSNYGIGEEYYQELYDAAASSNRIGRKTAMQIVDDMLEFVRGGNAVYEEQDKLFRKVIDNCKDFTAADLNRAYLVGLVAGAYGMKKNVMKRMLDCGADQVKAFIASGKMHDDLLGLIVDYDDKPMKIRTMLMDMAADPQYALIVTKKLEIFTLDDEIAACVARNRGVNQGVLKWLASHPDWQVRLEVAKNPNTPVEVLDEELADDPNKEVSYAARQNLSSPA